MVKTMKVYPSDSLYRKLCPFQTAENLGLMVSQTCLCNQIYYMLM